MHRRTDGCGSSPRLEIRPESVWIWGRIGERNAQVKDQNAEVSIYIYICIYIYVYIYEKRAENTLQISGCDKEQASLEMNMYL